jgi:uncharacterized low-complexity protein
MKRTALRAALAGMLALAPFTAAVAFAEQTSVTATVTVWHGDAVVASYSNSAACSGTECSVSVSMPNRDSGRYSRWCGASSDVVDVWAGATEVTHTCLGSATWSITTTVAMFDATDQPTTYPGDVFTTVSVAP